MELIKIEKERCIKCGMCTKVCPTKFLHMEKNGIDENSEKICIGCGQCTSVCPNSAIDNIKAPLEEQIKIEKFPVLDEKLAEEFLRSRRSIRCYKDIPVEKEKLTRLVDIARLAPTASNSQGISYIIIQNKELLGRLTEIVMKWMEEEVNKSSGYWSFSAHVQDYKENGNDIILRDAPSLILGIASKDFKNGRQNTISQFTYMELFATALGLGSCWAGLFEMCAFAECEPLLNLINIPKGKVVTGAVMVGYPKYKFQRLVDRNPLKVNFIE
ncbi:nitroreductase family protein [Clostridium neuense]|uniref:Nitroreductase family protein n=1 Tax=Clostridium neuense TaxID=1728934 RepID=A0ABW8TI38_9CLOT